MSDLNYRIDQRINQLFNFKRQGEWYRQGICPQCNKKELYTHAENPRIVKCGRINHCGYEEHVKDICQDLFKDWSKDFPKTTTNPNAAADAYLSHARGFDINPLQGHYSQHTFSNPHKFPNQSSATIRFNIGKDGSYWERLIDRPERFGSQKANIHGKLTGKYWSIHSLEKLAHAKEIWITEGIFDSIALSQAGLISASSLSCTNYPADLISDIRQYAKKHQIKFSPTYIFAFDNDKAGKHGIEKAKQLANDDNIRISAALPPKSKDWNELFLHEQLELHHLKRYQKDGQLLIADTAKDAALLIFNYQNGNLGLFHFVHNHRTYFFTLDRKEYDSLFQGLQKDGKSEQTARTEAAQNAAKIEEVCNVALHGLYFHRDEITDNARYFFQINSSKSEIQDTFTPEQLTSKINFTNRLLSLVSGAWWTGTDKQLQAITKQQTQGLKEVKTIDYIGYSSEHQSYIFNQHAVHNGKIIPINNYHYYQIGRTDVKTIAKQPNITLSTEKFEPHWYQDFLTVNGEKGLILLAWWTGSYFAQQIRAKHASYPFMEFVGQAGSGKSSLIDFLWKLSGRFDGKEGINPNSSSHAAIHRTMAQLSNMPTVFIEGDNKDHTRKHKFDWDSLKDAYNGQNIRSRGLKTQGNETYEPPFRGTIMISQNDDIKASEAILSRTLHVSVDTKAHTYQNKLTASKLYAIEQTDACQYISECLRKEQLILDTFFHKCAEIERDYHDKKINHIRIVLCHAQVAAMLEAIAQHVLTDVMDLDELSTANNLLQHMAIQRIKDLKTDHVLVQQFWAVYEYLANLPKPSPVLNHLDNHQYIALNLNEIYRLASHQYQDMPNINDMRELLKTSSIYPFVESSKAIRTTKSAFMQDEDLASVASTRTVRCWIFKNPYYQPH